MSIQIGPGESTGNNRPLATDQGNRYVVMENGGDVEVWKGVPGGSTYYFDGSDVGPTDPSADWTDDANAFDGSLSTFAFTSTAGSFLYADGTNAPGSGAAILAVYARVYGELDTSGTLRAIIYEDAFGGTTLGSPTITTPDTPMWSDYDLLDAPGGGWTWAKVQGLSGAILGQDSVPGMDIYRIEVVVNVSAVAEPICPSAET